MSITLPAYLDFIAKAAYLYVGIPVLIGGITGGLLNIVVFLSLRTFRQSSCAFYLTIMSAVNTLQLVTGLLARVMTSGFGIDWTQTSLFFCKFRYFVFPASSLMSFTCLCLATIDQYFATCSRPRWQQWSNIKLAHRLSAIFTIVWTLHGIPYLVLFDQMSASDPSKLNCASPNTIFSQYRFYFISLILTGFLPVCTTIVFGALAYYNVRTMTYRTLPLVRREHDKQLTTMVLTQDVVNFFTVLPYAILNIFSANTTLINDPTNGFKIRFATTMSVLFNYFYFGSPFFIYIFASERFRRQLIYVLFKVHLNRWRKPIVPANQIALPTDKSSNRR